MYFLVLRNGNLQVTVPTRQHSVAWIFDSLPDGSQAQDENAAVCHHLQRFRAAIWEALRISSNILN
jgi:hypothetical protein